MTRPLLLAAALVALAGCDSATDPDPSVPPATISPAAFVLGTDAFPDDARVAAGPHFAQAAVRVGVVSTVVGLHLVLPLAATDAANDATPTVANGTWTWATTAQAAGRTFRLRLDGTPEGSAIDWRMQTAEGDAPLATFYTGQTSLDGKTGSWRLFYPDAPGGVLTADFDVRDASRTTVTFGIPAGRDGAGSSVRYATDGAGRFFDWRRQPENVRAVIEWDETTRAGSITADDYNGGVRSCWNATLQDVPC